MSIHPVVSRYRTTLVAGGFALILPLSALAIDNVPPEALSVKVLPDRYAAAGRSFADLAELEAWAKPIRIRVLWLDRWPRIHRSTVGRRRTIPWRVCGRSPDSRVRRDRARMRRGD